MLTKPAARKAGRARPVSVCMLQQYLPDVARFDSWTIGLFFAAVTCLVIALVWLGVLLIVAIVKGWKRVRWPLGLLLIGILIALIPLAWTEVRTQIDLGPLDRLVDGQRHLTLTGWDRGSSDYQPVLASRRDTVLLQMANPDVTDAIVGELKDLKKLKELDLNDTAITDASLPVIAALPELKSLKLARTKITDSGFRDHISGMGSLENVNVQGTDVTPETLSAWTAAKEGRRALPRPPPQATSP
jgi:hypothetical protein